MNGEEPGRRSWIHFLNSRESAEKLENFIKEQGEDYGIFIVGAALIKGEIQTYDGDYYGVEGKTSLTLLTQSDGDWVVREMINQRITDWIDTVLLDDLRRDEWERGEHGGARIKKENLNIKFS